MAGRLWALAEPGHLNPAPLVSPEFDGRQRHPENVAPPFVSSERPEGQIGSMALKRSTSLRGSGKTVSANQSTCGPVAAALYQLCTQREADTAWGQQIEGSHALGLFNDAGDGVILDPFMGSGSTIAAASAIGVQSIGIERNDEYFRLASKAVPRLAVIALKDRNGQEA